MAGAILGHTSIKMIFEDRLVAAYIPHMVGLLVPWVAAILIVTYGLYTVRNTIVQSEE
jgi:hypothetical protein